MTTLVINRKNQSPTNTGSVYIGRPSIFGNPFILGRDGTRSQVIGKYEVYVRDRIKKDAKFREAVKGLRGKVLSCWCKPLTCHGDVLAQLAEELNA
jgi:uncharacterized protein DUF4326